MCDSRSLQCVFVPRLFEEKRRDMVSRGAWCVMRGSEFIVGTLRGAWCVMRGSEFIVGTL